jgi:hypothetical protein
LKKKRTPPFHWEITSFSCTTTLTIWNSLLTLDILFSKKMHQLGWTTGSKTMLLLSKGKNKTGNFLYFSHHFCQKKKAFTFCHNCCFQNYWIPTNCSTTY